jgi:hypothetical protein
METAQSNPFSEDSWSEQPIVAEQKNEAATTETVTTEKVKTEQAAVVDFNSYLKEKFGFENEEQALTEFQKLKETPKPTELKFGNEESEKFFNLLKDGKEDDVYSFLTEKKRVERLSNAEVTDTNVASEIVKFNLQKKYKDLSEDEIEYKFNKQFGVPEKPEQGLDETDEEYELKISSWEKEKKLAEKELIIEAKLLKPELDKYRPSLELPELPKAENLDEQNKEDFAKWEQARKQYEEQLESSYQSFKGISVTAKNEEVEIPVSFVPSDEEKAVFKEKLKTFDQNEYFGKRWINEDGSVKVEQMMNDIYLLENQEKAHQKLVNETAAKMLEHQVKKLGNINVNGERQTPISLENNQDEVSKMAEYFFSQT